MGLRLQLQQVCEPAVSTPPGQFCLQDEGSVCHSVGKNVPIFIPVMSCHFTHEIIKLGECVEIWKWAWCISRCRVIQLQGTKKKYTKNTRQSLCLSSHRFPLYCIIGSPDTPPPSPTKEQRLCTQNFSSFQTEVHIVS